MSCSGLTNPPAGDSEIEPLLEDLLWSLITRDISQLDSDLKSLHIEIKTPLGEKVRGRGQADTSRTIEKEREGEKKSDDPLGLSIVRIQHYHRDRIDRIESNISSTR